MAKATAQRRIDKNYEGDLLHQAIQKPSLENSSSSYALEVGLTLKQAREELGLSIQKVAKSIHVRSLYLEAIELGELERLPGYLYTSGFIRLYARVLGLDGEELLRRLSLENESIHFPEKAVYLTSAMEPNRAVIYVSTAIAIISLALTYVVFFANSPSNEQQSEPSSSPIIPSDIILKTENNLLDESDAASQHQESPDQKESSAVTSQNPSMATTAENEITLPEDTQKQLNETSSPLLIKAAHNCWMEVKRGDAVLFSRILRQGEEYAIEKPEECTISVGNAGGLVLKQNDTELPALGKSAQVMKGISLKNLVNQAQE